MAEDNEDIANYQVVEFTEEKEGDKRSVDCVPSRWIKFDISLGKCVAKFLGPPFTKEKKALLDDLRKTNANAPDSWLWYPVVLKGEAKTYSEGLKKTKVLKTKLFAYSTEDEEHCKERSVATTKKYEAKSTVYKEKRLNKIMSVQDLSDSSDVESESSPPDSHNEDLSSTEDEMPVRNENKNGIHRLSSPCLHIEQSRESDSAIVKCTNSTNKCYQAQSKVQRTTVIGSQDRQMKPNDTVSQPVRSKNKVPETNKISKNPQPQSVASTSKSKQIHGETLRVFSEDAKLLQHAITSMAAAVRQNSEDIKALRKAIEGVLKKKVNEVTIDNFAAKFEVSVPLQTVVELEYFIQRLEDNEEFQKQFVAALEHLIEEDVNKTVTCIVKKLFHRELAMVCTAVRKSKDKFLLGDTKLYATLFEFLCDHHVGKLGEPYTDREFKKTFSKVLYNSKDWDGHRSLRRTVPG